MVKLLKLDTAIEGKRALFGDAWRLFKSHNFFFCHNFDYDQGKFDSLLYRDGPESIYIRVPFFVVEGELDQRSAFIEFGQPYVIKHIVNFGLDWDENSLLTASGLNQFQKPLDKDAYIVDKSRWAEAGEEKVERVAQFF